MSTPNPNAWSVDKELPPVDGAGVDDQAALAFEIAAMRVRASWDELDSPPAESAPAPVSAPLDPFAPIVPGPASYPPPPAQAAAPLAPAEQAVPGAASSWAPSAPPASLESAVDTAPMMFAQAAPVAAPIAQPQRYQAQGALPSPAAFLPGKRAPKPIVIAVGLVAVVLLAIGLFSGGDDAKEDAQAESAPANEAVPSPVEAASAPLADPGDSAPKTARGNEGRLTAVAPVPSGATTNTATAQKAVAATPQPRASEPARESKASDKRTKRTTVQAAHARAQRHETTSVRASKSKPEPKRSAPAQVEAPKRKGTGFVSTNPY